MYRFYGEFFSKKVSNSKEVITHYLKDISPAKLSKEQSEQCEGEITQNETGVLENMICSKTPGNDGLTSEFYKDFWSELRSPFLLSYKSFLSG